MRACPAICAPPQAHESLASSISLECCSCCFPAQQWENNLVFASVAWGCPVRPWCVFWCLSCFVVKWWRSGKASVFCRKKRNTATKKPPLRCLITRDHWPWVLSLQLNCADKERKALSKLKLDLLPFLNCVCRQMSLSKREWAWNSYTEKCMLAASFGIPLLIIVTLYFPQY